MKEWNLINKPQHLNTFHTKKNYNVVYLISVAQSKTVFSWTNQTSPFYYDKQQNISDNLY
jgi:hypothetical protein